jgi:hypothetical protein
MSKDLLYIGSSNSGGHMTLPADLGDRKIAILAQSNKGKTYGLGVILEELAAARLPFVATDPANNLWGLRVMPDGSPSNLPVVVIGGPHGDIPIEKDAGERVAEALLTSPQCAVLDLSMESQGNKRRFMTAFSERLMRTRCPFSLPIFLEEAPDLIPQKAFGPQMQICKAAVAKLATIGGNFGYGVHPASQRPATIDKDVLSQCEALIVMGMTHKPDRKTVAGWVEAKNIGERVKPMFDALGSLQPGQAWLWWPSEDRFEAFTFRKRVTLHPREMKKLGLKPSAVQLGDASAFVERLRKEITKVTAAACPTPTNPKTAHALGRAVEQAVRVKVTDIPAVQMQLQELTDRCLRLEANTKLLDGALAEARRGRADAERRLEAVRKHLRPEYDALATLFGDLGEPAAAGGAAVDMTAWEPWLAKAGKAGCKRVLEALLKEGRMPMKTLAARAGIQYGNRSWRDYKGFLLNNHLATIVGEEIQAVQL